MKASEIRRRFLEYFAERGHEIQPSSSLVPADDPTLLFTNAGMVQFKKVFLGLESVPYVRATTSQKCVRAGGKHNDLEQVGQTARHHTFFEMLGNFSFGDYFKRDAIAYAWELLTEVYGLDPDRLYATVHHTDDEAAELWTDVAGLPPERVYRLGDKDNFWQMADTGPCGPCSELHYDLRPESEWGTTLPTEEFEVRGEAGEFLELWNLVFMQFDRDQSGELHPLPAPSIDTGAGLERIAAVLQGVDSNFHTDLFRPLIDRAVEAVGTPYDPASAAGLSYRVLADHARAVAFLLSDGVYPSNEGRGYVLRRILRRAVRHAWLLGRREPTLVHVTDAVVEVMGEAYPALTEQRTHILTTTRDEEERFLRTIEGGMSRFDQIAPVLGPEAASRIATGEEERPVIPGDEVFRLYDTFGFPPDLTDLMARERGYRIDEEAFETALAGQRERSRADRATYEREAQGEEGWVVLDPDAEQEFAGYDATEVDTHVVAVWLHDGRIGLQLRENPFYLEAGGQVSDSGGVSGDGWSVVVEDVERVGRNVAVFGPLRGDFDADVGPAEAHARVEGEVRHDTERNHTATHLLHAALRSVLGGHVAQRGSLVAPDRLRFDFSHTAPMTPEELDLVETRVNEGIWADHVVETSSMPYDEAVAAGAMALFGEKYGDVVRVVRIPDVSLELCGGTHVRHTGEIGLIKIVSESGIAAGVRRIEAVTGPGAFGYFTELAGRLDQVAARLKTTPENLDRRVQHLVDENRELESLLKELRKGGAAAETTVSREDMALDGDKTLHYEAMRLRARDADDVRRWGDAFLEAKSPGVAVVAAEMPGGKYTLFAFVSDDLIGRGIRADAVIREVAAAVGGRGGGRPHMAQAGVAQPEKLDQALASGAAVVRWQPGSRPHRRSSRSTSSCLTEAARWSTSSPPGPGRR
jgi:alanyl-tRNA synthetase